MKLDDFESALLKLAHDGTTLTAVNVAVKLDIKRAKAEKWMDELAAKGRLDTDVDMDEGVLVYSVPGLSVKTPEEKSDEDIGAKLARLSNEIGETAGTAATVGSALAVVKGTGGKVSEEKRKSMILGVALGLLPGVGWFYAAPWAVAIAGTVAAGLLYWLVAWIPFIGSLVMTIVALCSAAIGGVFTYAYNKHGKRTMVAIPGKKRLKP
jgi:hypothetical protein